MVAGLVLALLQACGLLPRKTAEEPLPIQATRTQAPNQFTFGGMQVVLQEQRGNLVQFSILLERPEGRADSPTQVFLDELLLRCLFNGGPENLSPNAYANALETNAMRMEYLHRPDYVGLQVECLAKEFQDAWQLIAASLLTPKLDKARFVEIRTALIKELQLRRKADPWHVADSHAVIGLFEGHPYAASRLANPAALGELSHLQLLEHYDRAIGKNRLHFLLQGPISVDQLATKFFGYLEELQTLPGVPAAPRIVVKDVSAGFHQAKNDKTNYVSGYFEAPEKYSTQGIALQIGLEAIKRQLQQEVCYRRNLTCVFQVRYPTSRSPYGQLQFEAVLPNPTVRAVLEIIQRFRREGIPPALLAQAKTQAIANYYTRKEQPDIFLTEMADAHISGQLEGWRKFPVLVEELTETEVQKALKAHLLNIYWSYYGNTGAVGRGAFFQ